MDARRAAILVSSSAIAGGAAFCVAIFAGYALVYLLLEYGRTP